MIAEMTSQTCQPSRFWRDSPAFLPDVPRPAKSWKCPDFSTKSDFVTLPWCPMTELNVITEIPFDFSQKYQTVPRPNRRATVYFGTQLISVGCILLKKCQCGPCQPSRFFPASPAFCQQVPLFFTRNVPLKTFYRLAGLTSSDVINNYART